MDFLIGTVYNNQGIIINHRSLVKVFLNPFLRLIGLEVATVYFKDLNKLGCTVLRFTKPRLPKIKYKLQNGEYLKRERRFI